MWVMSMGNLDRITHWERMGNLGESLGGKKAKIRLLFYTYLTLMFVGKKTGWISFWKAGAKRLESEREFPPHRNNPVPVPPNRGFTHTRPVALRAVCGRIAAALQGAEVTVNPPQSRGKAGAMASAGPARRVPGPPPSAPQAGRPEADISPL